MHVQALMTAAGSECLPLQHATSSPPPLVVDLDNTLVKTDLLIESLVALLKKQPFALLLVSFWLTHGIARMKREVARRTPVNIPNLPWRTDVIEFLKAQRAEGRSLVLATGCDMSFAQEIAAYLGLFDQVLASDGKVNLCGKQKRAVLAARFGERGFDYVADGSGRIANDLAVWRSARKAIVVSSGRRVRAIAAKATEIDRVFTGGRAGLMSWLKVLRPAHWVKNLLIFAPLVAAHRLYETALIGKLCVAFTALSFCASAGYLFNDVMDVEADRHHPRKRHRAFAAGDLPLSQALLAAPLLAITGCVLSAMISTLLFEILTVYVLISGAYSLKIRNIAVFDVLCLAGLYTIRILAGSAATGIWLSPWLLAFSLFLFLSLALVKRYSELVVMRKIDGDAAKARGYEPGDGELLAAMGITSGYLGVVVLSLYLAGEKAAMLYRQPSILWFLCLLLLYWVSYVWLTAHRGRMHDDPIVFAIHDQISRIVLLLMFVVMLLSGIRVPL
jgi:4-hydroxybenzoate polyprenyltransferase